MTERTLTGIVRIGCVEAPDPAGIAEQRATDRLNAGFGARNHKHTRRFHPGEQISLPSAEMLRLCQLGICELVVPGK